MKINRFLRTPPAVQMVVIAGLIYALSTISGLPGISNPVRFVIGLSAGALGALLLSLSIASFRRNKTTVDPLNPNKAQKLVTAGVFGITRNPMYVAMALFLISVCMITNSLLGLMLVPMFVINLSFNQIRFEEKAMTDLFGHDYLIYRGRTPRWVLRKG